LCEPGYDPLKYHIKALPTLCLFSGEKEVKRFIGVQQLSSLLEPIKKLIEKENRDVWEK